MVFEIGIALGLERPIFTIVHSTESLPFVLQTLPHLVGNVDDADVLRFHLSGFLRNMKTSTRAAIRPVWPITRPKTPPAETIAGLRRDADDREISEAELVDLVARAFKASGAEISFEQVIQGDTRPDAIAWPPGAPTDLKAPFIVEVAKVLRSPRDLAAKVAKVAASMTAARVRTSLLVVLDVTHETVSSEIGVRNVGGGYIFTLSLDVLLDLIERGRLLIELVEARNRFVHSGP